MVDKLTFGELTFFIVADDKIIFKLKEQHYSLTPVDGYCYTKLPLLIDKIKAGKIRTMADLRDSIMLKDCYGEIRRYHFIINHYNMRYFEKDSVLIYKSKMKRLARAERRRK